MAVDDGSIDVPKLLSKEDNDAFHTVFPQIVKDLMGRPDLRDMPETNRWLAKVLQYNVPHGKMARGLTTVLACRFMVCPLDEANVHLSYVLGWTAEMFQAYFLMTDDVMDKSETRRGRPCWYKVPEVGGTAGLNDGMLIEASLFLILQKYFQDKEYYVDLLEIMHDVSYKTVYGQSLDTRTGLERKMECFTLARYAGIVKYKTCYYSFYLPVRLAMAMAGIKDDEVIKQVTKVTLEIGHFFQVQDDFLDCYGDVNITGKIGTDIQDCKCSWLFVTALERATPEQKAILLENYGQYGMSNVTKVKEVYAALNLRKAYEDYEEQSFQTISSHIEQMSPHLPKPLFTGMLTKIYQRSS